AVLKELNEQHRDDHAGDSRLAARIASYELAAKMQLSAPQALDVAGETKATRDLYGLDDKNTADFGRNCLIARRLLERGSRFVQVWSGTGGASKNRDNHTAIKNEPPLLAPPGAKPTPPPLNDPPAPPALDDT